jgi:hypothetical protein
MAVPNRITIAREAGYHTDKIGKCEDDRQFMAFVVASMPLDKLRAPGGRRCSTIKSRAFSLRRRCNSAATAPSPLGAIPGSLEYRWTQPRTQLGSTPRLLAAAAIVYPC